MIREQSREAARMSRESRASTWRPLAKRRWKSRGTRERINMADAQARELARIDMSEVNAHRADGARHRLVSSNDPVR